MQDKEYCIYNNKLGVALSLEPYSDNEMTIVQTDVEKDTEHGIGYVYVSNKAEMLYMLHLNDAMPTTVSSHDDEGWDDVLQSIAVKLGWEDWTS